MKKNPDVDRFLEGAKQWKSEMAKLRAILLQTNLVEQWKWRLPCYTHEEKNVVIVQPFKNCLGLMFFKGALLKDQNGLLVENGPNSHSTRRMEFRSSEDVTKLTPALKKFLKEAVELEKAGVKVEGKAKAPSMPSELKSAFTKNSKLEKAFRALTPGRQRAYLLHFSSAKQAATREARIKKCAPKILSGKGLADR